MISFSLFTPLSFEQLYLYIFNWLFRTLVVIQLLCQRLAVEILISGLVFKEEDFIRPWEGKHDNMERYRLYTTFHLLEIPTLQFSFSILIISEISWFFHILSIYLWPLFLAHCFLHLLDWNCWFLSGLCYHLKRVKHHPVAQDSSLSTN